MSSASFQVYRHSGKFGIHGPVLALMAAVVVGFPLGFAYAYLVRWMPFIYVNVLATVGYGFVFGGLAGWLLRYGQVRNTLVAGLTGILVGCIALYFDWSAHVHAVFKAAPLFSMPDLIIETMKYLYENGAWSLKGTVVSGIPLAIVWVVEALIIVGLSVLTACGLIFDTPFCEQSQMWLNEEKKINTLEPFTDSTQVAALKSGGLGPLIQANRKTEGANVFTRLTLKYSPKCQTFCTVRLETVTLTTSKEGKVSETVEPLTGDLMLPHTMFDLIAKFESFQANAPSSAHEGKSDDGRKV